MTMPWFRSLRASARLRPAVAVSATAARRRAAARRSRPSLEAMECRQLLTTFAFPVTTVADNGDNSSPLAGSLRAAIIRADNVGPGNTAEIDFALAGGGPRTISPVAPLPAITGPTFLNATSAAGYSGTPLIQVDGSQAGAGAVGLTITSQGNGSKVAGLEVNAFSGGGVLLNGASNVTLDHDWVGVHTLIVNGTPRYPVPHGNGTFGVELINGSSHDTLSNDVVSGNQYNGVVIGSGSSSNTVSSSLIGTDPTGAFGVSIPGVSFGNGQLGGGGSGVVINGGSQGNVLHDDTISDNHDYGVLITDPNTSRNTLYANNIGTDLGGRNALPNHFGVAVTNQASANNIGLSGSGVNIISGNAWDGVQLLGPGTSSNQVANDYVGTNIAGTAALPNGGSGVAIAQGATGNAVAFDVISGNTHDGIYVSDSGTASNTVHNNSIGTDVTGAHSVPNQWGVLVQSQATSNLIGYAGGGNVISGNSWTAVELSGPGTSGNSVAYNLIGTDATGNAPLGNPGAGVALSNGSSSNTIGVNTISGNALAGVWISGSSGNSLVGNTIGLAADGGHAIANGVGLEFLNGSSNNTVGGTTALARNVISGNASDGLQLLGGSAGNKVEGNFIGTDRAGTVARPNGGNGVTIASGANGNTIGGPDASFRNIISGNARNGLSVGDGGTTGNIIQYNFIGTDVTGESPVSNGSNGVLIQNGASYTYVYNDLISANLADGVLVQGGATNNNFLSSSWIGLDATGTRAVRQNNQAFSNTQGVQINGGAYNTSVSYDVVSGNQVGVELDFGATSNWVVYDKIGTDVAGLNNVGNVADGILLNGVSNNLIGYDTIVYNGDVGILGENGSTPDNNSLVSDTFAVTVNGTTFHNAKGDMDFD